MPLLNIFISLIEGKYKPFSGLNQAYTLHVCIFYLVAQMQCMLTCTQEHTCDFEHTPKGMKWLCSSVAYKLAGGKLIEFDRGHKPNAPLNRTQAITVDMEDLPVLHESVWIGVFVSTCMSVLVRYGSCCGVISGTSVWIRRRERWVFELRINLITQISQLWRNCGNKCS